MLLKDLVIPNNIDSFYINKDSSIKIQTLLAPDFINNLLVYGPPGSGKYTLLIKALEKIVDKPIIKKIKKMEINNSWAHIKDVQIISSDYHFEINLSKYGLNKNNIFALIDELCDSQEINKKLPYRIILIRNLHKASIELIKFIRQKAEVYYRTIRFFVVTKTHSQILKHLNGIFFVMRVPSPNHQSILSFIKTEKIKTSLSDKKLTQLMDDNYCNLSMIFSMIEIGNLTTFYKTPTQIYAANIINHLKEKKLVSLDEIRKLIYEYQTSNESINNLTHLIAQHFFCLKNTKFSKTKKLELSAIMCESDYEKIRSYKEILHIEKLVFNIFRLYHIN